MLQVMLSLPVAVGLLGASSCRDRQSAPCPWSAPSPCSHSRRSSPSASTPASAGSSTRRRVLDPRPRGPLPARGRRDQPLPRRADGAAVGGGHAVVGLPAPRAPAALLLHARARRDGDARRLPRPGPAAVRPLLRPDADPVLLPDRRLGRREPDRRDDEDDRLHAGRLAADAGRGDRDRDPRLRPGRRAVVLARGPAAPTSSARRARTGSSGSSPPPSSSRCPPSSSTAGCRTPTRPRRSRCCCCSRACSPRSARTDSCASCCRSIPTPPCSSRTSCSRSASRASSTARSWPSRRPTCGSSRASRPSPSSASSRSGSSRCAPTGPTAPCCRWSTTGSSSRRVFLIAALLAERARSEDLRRMGGLATRAPMLAAMFLIVTVALLAMPGSANFIGEFFILNGVFQSKIGFAFVAVIGVALAASTRSGSTSARCTTACPRASSRARSRCATRSCSRRSSPASSRWRSTRD